MLVSGKYQRLISALLDATAERRIKWEITNIPNEFQTIINKNTVTVQCYEHCDTSGNCDKSPRYSLHLINKDGVNIDNCVGGNSYTHNEPEFLYEAARRSYYKVEDTIDEMLSILV